VYKRTARKSGVSLISSNSLRRLKMHQPMREGMTLRS